MAEIYLERTIGVVSQGVDCIADGRVFYIAKSLTNLKPPSFTKFTARYESTPVEIIGFANDDTSLTCPDCDNVYRRCLFLHTEEWMFSGLSCPNHPRRVLLDIFPKLGPETCQEWFNAYLGFGVHLSLPENVAIEGFPCDDYSYYLELRRRIKPSYALTQTGLSRLR